MKAKKILTIFLIVLAIIIFAVILYYSVVVHPFIEKVAEAGVKSMTTSLITETTDALKADQDVFNAEFYSYEKNNEGEIVLILANTYAINQLNFLVQRSIQNSLDGLYGDDFCFPLGAFSGSPLLSDLGPNVALKMFPIGSAKCAFYSEFQSAGINQSLHKLYLRVSIEVSLSAPLKKITYNVQQDIFISESVVVGRVPETYLEGSEVTDYLDLVP